MLGWAIFWLLVAVFNAAVGFTGIAYMSSGMAVFAFFVFMTVSIVTFLIYLRDRKSRGNSRKRMD